jgi:hypothetical protein
MRGRRAAEHGKLRRWEPSWADRRLRIRPMERGSSATRSCVSRRYTACAPVSRHPFFLLTGLASPAEHVLYSVAFQWRQPGRQGNSDRELGHESAYKR